MRTYRVLCKDPNSGRQYPLVFESPSADDAKAECEKHGHAVLGVEEYLPYLVPEVSNQPERQASTHDIVRYIAASGLVRSPVWTIALGVFLGIIAANIVGTIIAGIAIGVFSLSRWR